MARALVDPDRLETFFKELSREIREPTRLYLVGGSSAVMQGWRSSTADIDMVVEPDRGRVDAALPRLKQRLDISVEYAAPSDFLPELPGWQTRSEYVESYGKLHVYHYDFASQVLAKVERGTEQDLSDARSMMKHVDPDRLRELVEETAPRLNRYPGVDAEEFHGKVATFLEGLEAEREATVPTDPAQEPKVEPPRANPGSDPSSVPTTDRPRLETGRGPRTPDDPEPDFEI